MARPRVGGRFWPEDDAERRKDWGTADFCQSRRVAMGFIILRAP